MKREIMKYDGREGRGLSRAAKRRFDFGFSRWGSRSACVILLKRAHRSYSISFERTSQPQGLKPANGCGAFGTTQVAAFPILFGHQNYLNQAREFRPGWKQ